MMDDAIIISNLNDFVFCPVSIYFHNLYGSQMTMTYQNKSQINGSHAHKAVDTGSYSSRKNILTSLEVFSEKYNLVGKIDIYDGDKKSLTERKKKIQKIYDGYVFQLYAQYFCMIEMGFEIEQLCIYSMDDNKKYRILLPENDPEMLEKFEKLITQIKSFKMEDFIQDNIEKCKKCIYEPACDRGLVC